MDGYPLGSLDHNVPLVIFSGLTSNSVEVELDATLRGEAALLRSDLPPLDSKEAEILEQYFGNVDSDGQSWTAVPRDEPYRLRIKSVGRVSGIAWDAALPNALTFVDVSSSAKARTVTRRCRANKTEPHTSLTVLTT